MPLIKKWLQNCMENPIQHNECIVDTTVRPPTRLICVSDGKVRLCEASDRLDCPRYATLSHVWGSTQFRKLETKYVELFKQSIPLEALSKTFRDAIETTRYLGLQYLWIDSLCIVQDQLSDWEAEASRMATVYGNATINIAASSARDGNDGIFFARPSTWRCRIRLGDTAYDCQPSYKLSDFWQSPLVSRGWTLQVCVNIIVFPQFIENPLNMCHPSRRGICLDGIYSSRVMEYCGNAAEPQPTSSIHAVVRHLYFLITAQTC
jgi:hypothetical protein